MDDRTAIPGLGVVTMAFGADRYFRQAETLARSLRLHMPHLPISLLADRPHESGLFDRVVVMRPGVLPGTLQKIFMDEYAPYAENLFIDSDSLVVRPFDDLLPLLRRFEFTPVVHTFLGPGDPEACLVDVGRALAGVGGRRFPKFNGGLYFFRKGPTADAVFRESRALVPRAAELGIRDFDRAGPGDETLFALAMAKLGLDAPCEDGGRLMRTPLGSSGRLRVDPFRGTSAFVKYGKPVEPAIVHYCGPWITHHTYTLAADRLETGRPVAPLQRWARAWQSRLQDRRLRRRSIRGVLMWFPPVRWAVAQRRR